MIIRKKRIRAVERHFGFLSPGTRVVLGVTVARLSSGQLKSAGFEGELTVGSSVLPPATAGPVSLRNAEGHNIVHDDEPMETAYRQVEWSWLEFNGPYDRVEKSKIVDVPYERYPRTFVPPPGVELTVSKSTDGTTLLVTTAIDFEPGSFDRLLHTANLLLELFGACEVFTDDLDSIVQTPLRTLNWEVLPPGEHPWEKLRERVEPIISNRPQKSQVVIRHRLETIGRHQPAFVAVGRAGFRGYLIFGFPTRNLFVLESTLRDNATYVFAEGWKDLSRRTKAEILSGNLQKERIIHREGWGDRVDGLLAS